VNGVNSQESNLLTYLQAYLKFTTLGTVLSQVTLCSAKKNKGKISAQSCSLIIHTFFYSSSIQVGPLFVKNTENSMNSKKVVECIIIERPGGKRA